MTSPATLRNGMRSGHTNCKDQDMHAVSPEVDRILGYNELAWASKLFVDDYKLKATQARQMHRQCQLLCVGCHGDS